MENMTSVELKAKAKELGVKSWWTLKKSELIEAINAIEGSQNEPECTEEPELDKSSDLKESSSTSAVEPKNTTLKNYAAWVVDRETKELTTVVGEAESRETFYLSIKGKYRVRLITKPEKIEDECKQWEIKHARNKKIKNEKYAMLKKEAAEHNMSVKEYTKSRS